MSRLRSSSLDHQCKSPRLLPQSAYLNSKKEKKKGINYITIYKVIFSFVFMKKEIKKIMKAHTT